ncbi:MAG: Maf family nucleotide pyrophosphatase [Burkholderiaceae bacterium]|jgi:septum formation protein|nr:Maf family nucleotide pyrophosphatase [Burkholderiales bacterium]MCZ8340914.1 Maf family nucleotide pyrophosphatase [Burkholderiaceae bacterium]
MSHPPLILASTSPYRRELLQRLRIPFETVAPGVDEIPQPGETPAALARRLSLEKARAVAVRRPGALVIGSDQTATLDGVATIGKPGTHTRAIAQLRAASGRALVFHTGLCVWRPDGEPLLECVDTRVRFRTLTDDEIERYLWAETPYDCAGSAKSEGLGVTLLDAQEGPDPTALIGLPLIRLAAMLREAGLRLP